MRIISQDGTVDVPYEQVVVQQYERNIYCHNDKTRMKVATYSSEEKAMLAMQMLRDTYSYNSHEEVYKDGAFSYSPVFQFLRDEDIEIWYRLQSSH